MVINLSLSASYIINGDGSQKSDVQITSPNNIDDYARRARSAVVKGQLHLFGGYKGDYRKVRLLFFNLIFFQDRQTRWLRDCRIVRQAQQ